MGDFDGIIGLLAFPVGGVERIMDIIVIELDHISIFQGFNGLHDDFLYPETVVVELDLNSGLVVSVVDLIGGDVRNGGVARLESGGGHR